MEESDLIKSFENQDQVCYDLGIVWANKKEVKDALEETKKSLLASLMNSLDDGKRAETKLKRLAEGSEQYKTHIKALSIARGEEIRAFVKYQSSIRKFDKLRSLTSLERAKVNLQ